MGVSVLFRNDSHKIFTMQKGSIPKPASLAKQIWNGIIALLIGFVLAKMDYTIYSHFFRKSYFVLSCINQFAQQYQATLDNQIIADMERKLPKDQRDAREASKGTKKKK